MQHDVSDKSVVAAAQEVFDSTIAMWAWDEELAGAMAEENGRDPFHAQVEATRSRGPKVWTVYSTPDEASGFWELARGPLGARVTELEALSARREGHLVVEPGDTPHHITEKLKAVRHARRSLATAGAES